MKKRKNQKQTPNQLSTHRSSWKNDTDTHNVDKINCEKSI